MIVKTTKGNKVKIVKIMKITEVETGNGETVNIGIDKINAILSNGKIAEVYSLYAASNCINTTIGAFSVIGDDFIAVRNLFNAVNESNKNKVKSGKGMTQNPEWAEYNNYQNEGAGGYNPHPKYI